jgi:hypothetical protein
LVEEEVAVAADDDNDKGGDRCSAEKIEQLMNDDNDNDNDEILAYLLALVLNIFTTLETEDNELILIGLITFT